ncbi:hypothetical protein Bca4012_038531 [Brassica carinata]
MEVSSSLSSLSLSRFYAPSSYWNHVGPPLQADASSSLLLCRLRFSGFASVPNRLPRLNCTNNDQSASRSCSQGDFRFEILSNHRVWNCSIMLTETPFRPREKLLEKQRLFQSIQRHTYLKGPMDKV